MYTELQHARMVDLLKKDGGTIRHEMSSLQADLLHMTVGVSGESGELLDAVKKHVIYQKDLDLENVIEELGDIEFYLQGIRSILNVSRNDTLKHNLDKLLTGKNARYAEGVYSNQQAQDRADKGE